MGRIDMRRITTSNQDFIAGYPAVPKHPPQPNQRINKVPLTIEATNKTKMWAIRAVAGEHA
jgi:hypothetical protein